MLFFAPTMELYEYGLLCTDICGGIDDQTCQISVKYGDLHIFHPFSVVFIRVFNSPCFGSIGGYIF